ncbi:MAG: YraN family protein [Proteobacteria bacterium]|nr:YraN family protein [Pseudomonadota bacterium]
MGPSQSEGRRGEQLAAAYLERRGYRLIERNYRIAQGEIDLVAEDGPVLCFVEVRSRRHAELGHPLETIGPRKQARLIRAARHYLARHDLAQGEQAERTVRFDVVSIVYEPEFELRLVQGAFEVGTHWW